MDLRRNIFAPLIFSKPPQRNHVTARAEESTQPKESSAMEVTGLLRSSKPHGDCHATKEELREDGMKVMDDCPVCLDNMVLCRVGAHPSVTSTGNPID